MKNCGIMPKRGKYESFYHATEAEKREVDRAVKKHISEIEKRARKGTSGI